MFSKKNFQKYPLDTWKQFRQPNKIIFNKNPKCFPQNLKTTESFEDFVKKKIFLHKCPLDTKNAVLTTMSKKIYRTSNNFLQSSLVSVNFLEGNYKVMQEDRLNQCRKQFFKSGRILSGRSLQSFSSILEKTVKVKFFLRKQTFIEKFCCSSRKHIWHFLWSFCGNVVDFSAHSWKTVTKLKKFIEKSVLYKFIKKKIIFNKIIFAKKPKCFPQSLKTTESFEDFEKKKIICAQMSSGHKENSFDHHVKKIFTKFQTFSLKVR